MGLVSSRLSPRLACGCSQRQDQRSHGLHHRCACACTSIRQDRANGGDQLPMCPQETAVSSIFILIICVNLYFLHIFVIRRLFYHYYIIKPIMVFLSYCIIYYYTSRRGLDTTYKSFATFYWLYPINKLCL